MTSTALVATQFCLFTVSSALAQDDAAQPERETIVVTATRNPTPISQVASSITVITAADVAAKQEQTLPEVLKDVPGLNIVHTGGPGGQTSVFMRGTNSNHVKVLVHVKLRVQAPFGAPNTSGNIPFFKRLAAVRRAFRWVASIIH